jgi:hypothetical protein
LCSLVQHAAWGVFIQLGHRKKFSFLLAGNHTSLQIRSFDGPKSVETKSYVANYMSCARSSTHAPEWEEYYSALNEQDAALASGLKRGWQSIMPCSCKLCWLGCNHLPSRTKASSLSKT